MPTTNTTDDAQDSTQDDEPTLEEVHENIRNIRVEVLGMMLVSVGVLAFYVPLAHLVAGAWEAASMGVGLSAITIGLMFSEGHRGNRFCQRAFDLGRRAVRREPINWNTGPEDHERN